MMFMRVILLQNEGAKRRLHYKMNKMTKITASKRLKINSVIVENVEEKYSVPSI